VKIVLDTNVLVSGLISPFEPPGRIVDLLVGENLYVLYDDRILSEYRDVLARPRLQIDAWAAEVVVELIQDRGILVSAPPLAVELPDPDDLPFLEVAHAGAAAYLITGNEKHFQPTRGSSTVPVVSPAGFLSIWLARARDL
jgi:uncharacterized protein